ncbi:fimbrial protein [Pseudomonas edaphica]|uniref:fimbrial protein n=1 Tax=Pseudomonas edaphica TaxID=2006980 RepID=UPI003D0B6009
MNITKFAIVLLVVFPALAEAVVTCSQITGQSLTPSLAAVPNNTGGVLSSAWHTADLGVRCSGMPISYMAENKITPAGVDSGKTLMFEGVSYKLYSTSDSDVFYFGGVAGPDGINRPFGKPYAHTLWPPEYTEFIIPATVNVRFYSTSKSMTPGVHTINNAGLVKGQIFFNRLIAESSMNLSAFSFVVNGPSCKLTVPAELKLKSVNLSAIPMPGNTVEAASFQLGLACAGSTPAYQVSYSMIDINDAANPSSTLTLTDGAYATTGVSLQVVEGGTPVTFGATSKHSFGWMPNGGGMIGKAMSVRYIRTAPVARPGSVKAGVTVTLSYK